MIASHAEVFEHDGTAVQDDYIGGLGLSPALKTINHISTLKTDCSFKNRKTNLKGSKLLGPWYAQLGGIAHQHSTNHLLQTEIRLANRNPIS